jgi:hypothetical protein
VARETTTRFTDDIDGSAAETAVTFALRGVEYEIDLSGKNVAALEKALAKYIAAGRKAPRTLPGQARRPESRTSGDVGTIRAWARSNGYAVSSRGRIPAEVRQAYENAN